MNTLINYGIAQSEELIKTVCDEALSQRLYVARKSFSLKKILQSPIGYDAIVFARDNNDDMVAICLVEKDNWRAFVNLYVRPSYRRMGIGLTMIKLVDENYPDCTITGSPGIRGSLEFFYHSGVDLF